jgi:hypothetical protein
MGWRFRKTFGRGPFRWTLSKRGIGYSWGIPGFRYGVGADGRRHMTFSIPGTGISWVKYLGRNALISAPPMPPQLPPPPPNPSQSASVPWWKQSNNP